MCSLFLFFVFFFKQKTAYEMRISDWSSDVCSSDLSGVVPSSFRLLRQLLSRIEDADTGRILPEGLQAEVPADRLAQAKKCAEVLGTEVYDKFPDRKSVV